MVGMMCASFVNAGNTDSYAVTLKIGNGLPNITSQDVPSASPTQNTYTEVNATFTAYDPNGYVDLNASTAECTLHDNATRDSDVVGPCYATQVDPITGSYICPIHMLFYDPADVYHLVCSISDMGGGSSSIDNATAFTYGSLTAISVVQTSVGFAQLAIGGSYFADSEVSTYNEGNVAITNVSVKAYDLKDLSNNYMDANNFNMSAEHTLGTGNVMANNTYKQIPTLTISTGATSNQPAYLSVHVPNALIPGNYASTQNWVLAGNP